MTNELMPAKVRLNDELGAHPERAGFEAAAAAHGLSLARNPEWCRLDGMSENDRPYYNGRTNAAWWAWRVAPRAAPAWQPIETAPKDKELLLRVGIALGEPLVKQGCWFHIDGEEKGWIDTDGWVVNATHWMPLPAAPA